MDLISSIVVSFISIISIVYGYFKYSFNYWKSRGVPFDDPSIPHGHIKDAGSKCHLSDIITKMYNKYKPTGAPICGVYFFTKPVAIILDLELVKNVYIKDFVNFDERNVYVNEVDDPIGANLFTLDGESWKKLRNKLTPTFSSGKMKFMFPTVVEIGERLRDNLHKAADGNDLDIKEWCTRFTTDVIGNCAFGIECDSLKDEDSEFQEFRHKVAKRRHGALFIAFLTSFKHLGRMFHVKVNRDDVSTFMLNMVRDTVDYRKKNDLHRNDFMDILIKLNETDSGENALTLNEIAAQTFVFFQAGFETSSTTLTSCLYELSLNPSIQDKARRVIQETYEKYGSQLTYEMIMDIPYITQIIEETMRKHSVVPVMTRGAKNDYQIPGTDIVIEKGMSVVIPVSAIQSDPEYYPNPEVFDPDRFENNEKKKRNPMTWLPFGSGPRNCIGLRFAMMQMQIGLIYLLQNFKFSLGAKTPIPLVMRKVGTTYTPEGSVYLNVKPLNSQ